MTKEQKIASLFKLNNENWMRHANPWSVWTRYSVLPLIVLACWSRVWVGWWCIVPVALSLAWMGLNPILFKKPKSTNNWASKSVFGERVYANRDKVAVPEHHHGVFNILNSISFVGMLLTLYGIFALSGWAAAFGVVMVYLGKSWYLDRMVWLYEDMKNQTEYSTWLY